MWWASSAHSASSRGRPRRKISSLLRRSTWRASTFRTALAICSRTRSCSRPAPSSGSRSSSQPPSLTAEPIEFCSSASIPLRDRAIRHPHCGRYMKGAPTLTSGKPGNGPRHNWAKTGDGRYLDAAALFAEGAIAGPAFGILPPAKQADLLVRGGFVHQQRTQFRAGCRIWMPQSRNSHGRSRSIATQPPPVGESAPSARC